MKTFEEALGTVTQIVSEGQPVTLDVEGVFARYDAIAAQVRTNALVERMIDGVMNAVLTDAISPYDVAFLMFMNGLIVGIEMEKAE